MGKIMRKYKTNKCFKIVSINYKTRKATIDVNGKFTVQRRAYVDNEGRVCSYIHGYIVYYENLREGIGLTNMLYKKKSYSAKN